MKQKPSSKRTHTSIKSILRLPDLEYAKAAVLNSFNSVDAKRGYRHGIDEFIDWYCSEPRLAFNRIVVHILWHSMSYNVPIEAIVTHQSLAVLTFFRHQCRIESLSLPEDVVAPRHSEQNWSPPLKWRECKVPECRSQDLAGE